MKVNSPRPVHILILGLYANFILLLLGCGGSEKASDQQKEEKVSEKVIEEAPLPEYMVRGKEVYEQYCLVCHQASGGGVPGLNPPIKGTEYVTGDKSRLIGIVLKGSNVGLEVNGVIYENAMPPHDFLTDQQVADVLSYIRNSFGNEADKVEISEVKVIRDAG